MSEQTQNLKYKRPFYLHTGIIIALSCFWPFGIPLLIALVLMVLQIRYDNKFTKELKSNVTEEVRIELDDYINNADAKAASAVLKAEEAQSLENELKERISVLNEKHEKQLKQESNLKAKIKKLKPIHKAVMASVEFYHKHGEYTELEADYMEILHPSVDIPLHTQDTKVLKQQAKNVNKHIDLLIEQNASRYTTKANQSIYSLMVIALKAELQNILINLKYDKIENTRALINEITLKYIDIAGKGNKAIHGNLVKFIGELESLFLDLANIEYEYYVKREREKEEQRLIREQMAQEAAERKLLKEQQKKIEKEEQKYHQEIENVQEMLDKETDDEKLKELEKRIAQLAGLLEQVEEKKEEISNLQNGKAGNVYIISNIGSFGEGTYKVGMTRRLEPQDRIKELSSASVPFSFDVHSMVFSEDAPALEKKMHDALHKNRVNKVNLRKEFFKVELDDMEQLVFELDPTAEFKRTLISHEYQQTLEIELKEHTS